MRSTKFLFLIVSIIILYSFGTFFMILQLEGTEDKLIKFYPLSSWEVFPDTWGPVEKYDTIRILSSRPTPYEEPVYFVDFKEGTPFKGQKYIIYRLFDELVGSMQNKEVEKIASLTRELQRTLNVGYLEFEVVTLQINPRDYYRNRGVLSLESHGILEITPEGDTFLNGKAIFPAGQ